MLNLVEHLPRDSFYIEALADDDELADTLAALQSGGPRERISDWSPEMGILAGIFDRLGTLISAQIAAAGVRPPRLPAHPRPVTAIDRARRQAREAQHRALNRRLLGHD